MGFLVVGLWTSGLIVVVLGMAGYLRLGHWGTSAEARTGGATRHGRAVLVGAQARGPAMQAPLSGASTLGWRLSIEAWVEGEGWVPAGLQAAGRLILDDGSGPLPLAFDRLPDGVQVEGLPLGGAEERGLDQLGAITALGIQFRPGLRLQVSPGLLGKAERWRVREELLQEGQAVLLAFNAEGQVRGVRVGPLVWRTLHARKRWLWVRVAGFTLLAMALFASIVQAAGVAG